LFRICEVVKEKVCKEIGSQKKTKEKVSKESVGLERISQTNCSRNVNGIASGAGG